MHDLEVLVMSLRIKDILVCGPVESRTVKTVLLFQIYRFIVVNVQIKRFFFLSIYRFIVSSFYVLSFFFVHFMIYIQYRLLTIRKSTF